MVGVTNEEGQYGASGAIFQCICDRCGKKNRNHKEHKENTAQRVSESDQVIYMNRHIK
jgi:hypothetical protein